MNISERQNNINNLKSYLQEDIDADYELIDYIFFDKGDIVGVIYCLEALEKSDEHCDQCKNELLCLKFKTDQDLPYLSVTVGPTKFNKILSDNHKFWGLDLTGAKIYNSSCEVINERY
jgi:hypothetical protein